MNYGESEESSNLLLYLKIPHILFFFFNKLVSSTLLVEEGIATV